MTGKIETPCGIMFRDTIICHDRIVRVDHRGFCYTVGNVAIALFDGWRPHWRVVFNLGGGWDSFPNDGTEYNPADVEAWLPIIEAVETLQTDPEFEKVSGDSSVQWALNWCEQARRTLSRAEEENQEATC